MHIVRHRDHQVDVQLISWVQIVGTAHSDETDVKYSDETTARQLVVVYILEPAAVVAKSIGTKQRFVVSYLLYFISIIFHPQ